MEVEHDGKQQDETSEGYEAEVMGDTENVGVGSIQEGELAPGRSSKVRARSCGAEDVGSCMEKCQNG